MQQQWGIGERRTRTHGAAMEASANPRASRWSDAPPGQSSSAASQDGSNAEKRPPSTAPEPPLKKSRFDSVTPGFLSDASAGYGANSEVPPARSTAPGPGHGTFSTDQSYNAPTAHSGEHSYSSFAPGSARGSGTGALFYKTKLCTKFKLGSCTFNERCHFAHGVEELRKPPPGWEEMVKQGGGAFGMGASGRSSEPPRKSNKPCRFYAEGHCPYGERCTFSHGPEDLQKGSTPTTMEPLSAAGSTNAPGRSNYKTRLCTRWEKGELCIYGDKCHFAHGQAELQAYSGASGYNNTGATAPNMYSDPSVLNPPPLNPPPMNPPPVNAPYGAPPMNYGSIGGPPPAAPASLNPYPVTGATLNSYGAQQDGSNGYSTNYGYWNPENKWDGANPSVPAPTTTIPTQTYGQPNQAAPWMPNYSVDGGYAKTETGAAPYYNPEQTQQQQNISYYGSAPTYQDPNQSVSAPYSQDATQNGVGGPYFSANYANPQAGYTGTYNTA